VGLEIRNDLTNYGFRILKRLIDVLGAISGLLLLAPLMLLLAFLIKLDSPGPVLYWQWRLGKNGKPFKMLKFRTMHFDADCTLEDALKADGLLRREWDRYQKLRNDPRVTRVGRLLRRFSIDELPQLWNVLKGEMSLVGPRPFFTNQLEDYGNKFQYYVLVRPGLTGMWQISGRNKTSFAERADWDQYYVSNWSLWLEIYILARTLWVVFRSDGAF
jgi:Undecaprenyl-phosphate galactose phosphotransferase WbaP